MNSGPDIQPGFRPKVLLADSNYWALASRLAVGLKDVGCEVLAVCPDGHSLSKTSSVRRTFPYSGLRPLASLMSAIDAAGPDFIVPCCERSLGHFHELYSKFRAQSEGGNELRQLIERSLGAPSSHSIVVSRYRLLELAKEEGIRVPRIARIHNQEEIDNWCSLEPFPWVLKVDGTWGGGGVSIVRTPADAKTAMAQLGRMFRFRRAAKRLIVNRDRFDLRTWWKGADHEYSIQSFIQGRPGNCAVISWKGQVLAGIGVEVVRSDGATGPANLVRVVENVEMMQAAKMIASRLNLSGFFGLDFVIEEGSGHAYLIEMNPRTTPLCHLRLGKGRDMIAALYSELAGQPCIEAAPVTQKRLIAYFPQEEQSPNDFPEEWFYDVPSGEPQLMKEILNPFPNRTLLFRLFETLSRKAKAEDRAGGNDWHGEAGNCEALEDSLLATVAAPGKAETSSRGGGGLDLQ